MQTQLLLQCFMACTRMEEMNDFAVIQWIIAVGLPTLCTSIIIPLVSSLRSSKLKRSEKVVYGVVGKRLCEPLAHLPDYTDYHKAINSSDRKVVLHCRTLSFALRKCDFVCADMADDVKIYAPDDPVWEQLVEK